MASTHLNDGIHSMYFALVVVIFGACLSDLPQKLNFALHGQTQNWDNYYCRCYFLVGLKYCLNFRATQKWKMVLRPALVETLSCRKRWLICETNCVNRVQCGLVVCHWKNVKRKCDLQKKPKIVTSFRRKKREPPGPN